MNRNTLFIWNSMQKYAQKLSIKPLIHICVSTNTSSVHYTADEMCVEFSEDEITIAAGNFFLEFDPNAISETRTVVNDTCSEYYFSLKDMEIYISITENQFAKYFEELCVE